MAAGNKALAYLEAEDRSGAAFKTFNTSIERSSAFVGKLSGAIAGLGGFAGVGALAGLVKSAANTQDELGKMAQRVGVSVESLSELRHAAALSDVNVEELGVGLRNLGKHMVETQASTGEAAVAFKALGVAVTNSSGQLRTTEETFGDIADKFADMQDGAGKTALAMRLFGRSGSDLIPLLNGGRDGLKQAADEARRFGIVISTEAAKQAEAFNDNLTRLSAAMEGLKLSIGNSAIPALAEWTAANVEAIKVAGGMGEALRLFVFNIEAFSAEKPREQIQRLTKALEDYQAASAPGKFAQSPTGFLFGGREEDLKKQIEFLKVLERQDALRGNENIPLDPGLRRFVRGKSPAPALPDEGALKRGFAEMERLRELDRRGWIAYADGVFEAADAENLALAKIGDVFFAEQERLRQEDIRGWVAHAEAVFEAADAENLALAKLGEEVKKTDDLMRELGLTFSSAFEDALVGGKSFSEILAGIEKDLLRLAARELVTKPLLGEFEKILGGVTGGKGFGDLIGSVFSGAGGLSGFATGGSFNVGGAGGTDSQLVAFRATPGERVTVTPPGQAGGSPIAITVNVPQGTSSASAQQIAAETGRAVNRALRRNG